MIQETFFNYEAGRYMLMTGEGGQETLFIVAITSASGVMDQQRLETIKSYGRSERDLDEGFEQRASELESLADEMDSLESDISGTSADAERLAEQIEDNRISAGVLLDKLNKIKGEET